jgi:hypothetical protein
VLGGWRGHLDLSGLFFFIWSSFCEAKACEISSRMWAFAYYFNPSISIAHYTRLLGGLFVHESVDSFMEQVYYK